MEFDQLLKLFNLYSWGIASIIMIIVAAIAKFYQEKFEIPTYYYIYFIPVFVFFSVLLQIYPIFGFEAEFIEFSGSVISFIATYFLYIRMVGVK